MLIYCVVMVFILKMFSSFNSNLVNVIDMTHMNENYLGSLIIFKNTERILCPKCLTTMGLTVNFRKDILVLVPLLFGSSA